MKKFRELTNVQKVAVVGTGIAVPVVGLGVVNFAATRKAKVNVLKNMFNVDDVTKIDSVSIEKVLDTKMSEMTNLCDYDIRHTLFSIFMELTSLYPSRLLSTAGRVNAVPELLEMISIANEILKLCYSNTSDSMLHDIGENVVEIVDNIFYDDNYFNLEVLKFNIKEMENILDEIEIIVMEEADDFFEDEESTEPENCFDVFKSDVENKTEESAPEEKEKKETHSEEIARKNAISDEEAFEQAKKIYKNMPEKFKSKKLDEMYGVESSAEKTIEEAQEATEAKKEEAKEIASEIAEQVLNAAEKTLELDNSNQKYPAKRASKSQKSPTEKKTVRRKSSATQKEVTVNE